MSSSTMHAVRYHDYGGPEQLVFEQVPCPDPKPGEVVVRIVAAGVNPADWKIRSGFYREFMPVPMPWIPGLEAAGVVEAVGEGVTEFTPGDAVYGTVNASYAGYAAVAVTELDLKPANLSFVEAATVPVGALTAWAALEAAGIQSGQRVLVHGAAGGVGLFAVQLARLRGAQVIGTASTANVDFVRSLGAEPVDYRATAFETAVHDVDVVVDAVGPEVIERSWQVLKPGGFLVTVAAMLSPEQGQAHGVRATSVGRASPGVLPQLSALLASGQLRTEVGPVFPLSQARQAQELSQTGHGRGRIVLKASE